MMIDGSGPMLTWLLLALVAMMALSLIGWRYGDRLLARRRRARVSVDTDFTPDDLVPDRLNRRKVRVGDVDRVYELYVPPDSQPARALPVVFVFHGGGGSPAGIAQASHFHVIARRQRFLVVYPTGTPHTHAQGLTWNAGGAFDDDETADIDDTGFFQAMLAQLRADFAVDERRIYVTGLSRGGMLAYHLACLFPGTVAAVAAVATVMTTTAAAPSTPVPVLHIHGTADERVPIDGGVGGGRLIGPGRPPVADTIAFWRRVNGCGDTPITAYEDEEALCVRYTPAAGHADVEYCIIQGCGHLWPGALRGGHAAFRTIGSQFPATEYMWTFFKEHPRPGAVTATAPPRRRARAAARARPAINPGAAAKDV